MNDVLIPRALISGPARAWWHARSRGVTPLAALSVITAVVGWLSVVPGHLGWLLGGLALYLVLLGVQLTRSPAAVPVWATGLPLIWCYLAFALTREGTGAAASGFTPLAVLLVVGASLHGRRRDVVISLIAGTGALTVPVLLAPASYPVEPELKRAVLWLLASALVGGTIQRLVLSHRQHIGHLALLADTSRTLSTAADPRDAICQVARQVCTADVVYLLEPDTTDVSGGRSHDAWSGDHHQPPHVRASQACSLVSTAAVGEVGGWPAPVVRVDLSTPSLTARAFRGEHEGFVADLEAEPGVSDHLRIGLHVASAVWQPVVASGQRIGVLMMIFHDHRDALPSATEAMLATLAADAGIAIEREDLLAQTKRMATHDALTGLSNRHHWDVVAEREVATARRNGTPVTFALLDVDHFKGYNDSRGHLTGDQLLREFAHRAAPVLREVDTLARWVGRSSPWPSPGAPHRTSSA